jgi:hypothetical protein
MAASGGGSNPSAAACAYGNAYKDCDHGKIEQHPFVVHHCNKINWRSQNCKIEHREIRHCEKKRSKQHCLEHASPMRR